MTKKEEYFVVRNASGEYLAVDGPSGGYPFWTGSFINAKEFRRTEQDISYIRSSVDAGSYIRIMRIELVDVGSIAEFENSCMDSIRTAAILKLSAIERRALGLED